MNALNKRTLSQNIIRALFVACFLTPCLLRSNTALIKDSLLIIKQSGKDKRYYKACAGKNVKLLCSQEKNEITILALGEGTDKPIVAGRNDYMCSETTNILLMGLKHLLTGQSGYRKLGAIPLAGN